MSGRHGGMTRIGLAASLAWSAGVLLAAPAAETASVARVESPSSSPSASCRQYTEAVCARIVAERTRYAAAGVSSLSSDGAELRGLGLASLSAVVGTARAAAVRSQLDRELVGKLTGPLSPRRRPATLGSPSGDV